MIPSLNACVNQSEILGLNGKFVRFECMVQDMYDEEYFYQVLKPASNPQDLDSSLFYKYYSDMSDAQI